MSDRSGIWARKQKAIPGRTSNFTSACAGSLAIIPLLCAIPVNAQSARNLVQQGNQAYESGNYKDALDSYEEAAALEPDSARIWFNKGDALYQQGEFDKAADAYEQAALRGEDSRIEALSKFNQGNASFRGGIELAQENPKQALAGIERGVRLYQDALDLDPSLNDARYNVEVARRAMKALMEQLQNQPQQGGQQQSDDSQGQDPQEQLEDLAQQQQQAAGQSGNLSRQQQSQGNSSQVQQQSRSLADQQQELTEQTQQLADQMDSQRKDAQEHLENAAEKQRQAEEQLRNQQLADAKASQEQASEEMEKALKSLSGEEEEGDEQQQANQQRPSPAEQQKQDEALKNADDILNQERANRRNRASRTMARIRPVEKDW